MSHNAPLIDPPRPSPNAGSGRIEPAIPDTCATRYGPKLSAIGSPANGVLELVADDDRSGAYEAVKGRR